MRIRKLFHLSSLSDPQLSNRSSSMVQHHHHLLLTKTHQQQQNGGLTPSQPSDPQIQTITSVCSGRNRKKLEGVEDEDMEKEMKMKKNKHDTFRQEIIRSACGAGNSSTATTNPSNQVIGRWSDADKIYPPKKRRVNFVMTCSDEEGETKPTMSSKMNKKCSVAKTGSSTDGKELNIEKKPKRGNVIMEGSRCSRVNGRGWRCCQPTLVGYSLCEHHLGKGRLRSMQKKGGSERLSNSKPIVREKRMMELMSEKKDEDDDMGGEEKKMEVVTKKRVRLGVVKARSLSSLLAQEDTAVLVVDRDNGGE